MSDSPPKLERNPFPIQMSDIGPAQFRLEITNKGGLPAHREQRGIVFRQDPELPEGISRRSLPIVDQGTLKQGTYISPVASNQQYPIDSSKINSLGRQVESRMKSSGSITFNATEKPLERAPPPMPNNNIGPAQYFLQLTHMGGLPAQREQRGIRFRQDPELPEGISRRSLPIVDQGTLKQGQPISAVSGAQQYPVKSNSSMGQQINSRMKSSGSITFNATETPLERAPAPEPNNNLGPAQYLLQLTHTGGLPAQREQKGIRFRQDPELPEGISRRSLPVVDQGTLKQGVAVSAVDQYQQYPVKYSNSLGRQVQSRHRSSGTVTMSRRQNETGRAPPPISADTNGPAQFNLSRSMSTGQLDNYPAKEPRTITRAEAIKKGSQLFNLSMPRNDSISSWLQEHGKEVKLFKQKGNGKLRQTMTKKKKKKYNADPNVDTDVYEAEEKKDAKDEINTIQDWLDKNGLPGKHNIFKAEFERRDRDKSGGHVKPTFVSVIPKYKY
ncbi:hypothetical protein TrVE_jg13678 [Triparma verrucosa]|uniref:Uncharacterized protein n=1 Tax=Triparma verrucosa TaxID=1606542 RepID=A0A9W7BT80_9STRA|nr:hypothetical protein TrVE_jg13678 [Triparma verrucosa]